MTLNVWTGNPDLDSLPKTTMTPTPQQILELDEYDAGLLSDFGGGNVEWWQDYIRAELGRAHDFYQSQAERFGQAPAVQQEPVGVIGWAANVPNSIREVHWAEVIPPIGTKLYTASPMKLAPLTADRVEELFKDGLAFEHYTKIVREVEAAHGEPVGYIATEDLEDQREYPDTCRVVNLYFDPQCGTEAVYTAPQPTPELVQAAKKALRVLAGFADIIEDSEGVGGYHENGNLAEWGEFSEPDDADDAIAALQNALKGQL